MSLGTGKLNQETEIFTSLLLLIKKGGEIHLNGPEKNLKSLLMWGHPHLLNTTSVLSKQTIT